MTEPIRTYRDLIAWRLAMDAAKSVYRLTSDFPADERFGLVTQLRRAVVSIPSNIAEGFGRGRSDDYRRFLRVARGSLYEVETQITLAEELGFAAPDVFSQTKAVVDECGRVLAGLIRKLEELGTPGS